MYYTASKGEDGIVMVCHHGAGWSGLTFACFAKEVALQSRGECGVLALDMRGHGELSVTRHSRELTCLCMQERRRPERKPRQIRKISRSTLSRQIS